jgi:uncharacterized protein YjbI with pentapeptide repeats
MTYLMRANLQRANLEWMFLIGANLDGATLDDVRLRAALYDDSTTWPDGFDPDARGARLGTAEDWDGGRRYQW